MSFFNHYSVTISGLIIMIASQFMDAVTADAFAADAMTVIGIVLAWYGRYRQGDIDLLGVKN